MDSSHKIALSPWKRSLFNTDLNSVNNEVLDFPSCTEMAREGVLSPRPGINCVHDAEPAKKAVLNREAFTNDVRKDFDPLFSLSAKSRNLPYLLLFL